jgi:uncharacterized membrane protein HdeD (DUF308 family)
LSPHFSANFKKGDLIMERSAMHMPQVFASGPMLHALAENWWLILLKGLCAIVFGLLTLAWPGVTVITLVLLYGAFALVDGVLALAAAIKGGIPAPRWWLAIVGVIGIAAGLLTFGWPGITALVLLFLIAVWAITTGIMQIVGAIRLRKEIDDEWLLIAGGVLSVLFGIVLVLQPRVGLVALVSIIGAYAILYGLLEVWFAWRLQRHRGVTV